MKFVLGYCGMIVITGLTTAYVQGRAGNGLEADDVMGYTALAVLWPLWVACGLVIGIRYPFRFVYRKGCEHKEEAIVRERQAIADRKSRLQELRAAEQEVERLTRGST